jgi:aconitase B
MMKNLKYMLIASAMVLGVGSSAASADCCVTNCCKVVKCWKEDVKFVPYKVCNTVCVAVTDACGNVTGYKNIKQYTTKYKKVVVKTPIACCCN